MTTESVFVARERELAQLSEFLDTALAGQGQICFVVGEAGSGKTALVTEFARRAEKVHPDLIVALGNCSAQTGLGDPYLPFREILALLTGDVEGKLAQGAINRANADRLRGALHVVMSTLVEIGPDLIDIFVPGSKLAAKAATFAADQESTGGSRSYVASGGSCCSCRAMRPKPRSASKKPSRSPAGSRRSHWSCGQP